MVQYIKIIFALKGQKHLKIIYRDFFVEVEVAVIILQGTIPAVP